MTTNEIMEDVPPYEPKSAYFRGIPIEDLNLDQLRRAYAVALKEAIGIIGSRIPYFDPETVDDDGDKGYGWVQTKGVQSGHEEDASIDVTENL